MSVQGHRHGAEDTLPGRKLEIVSFRECAVRYRLIKKIADNQQIKSFLYTPGSPQLKVNKGATFTEKQILGHLESSKHSLKSLVMFSMRDYEHTRVRRDFDCLENLHLPFPGIVPCFDANDDLEIVKNLLGERVPASLKELVLDRLLHVEHAANIAEAMAHLKLQGFLPNLKGLQLNFGEPLAMHMMGIPPQTLEQITARIEKQVGNVFKKAKLKLKFEEAE